jgi:threonine/homoserine/homoserine lactone efflux protein
MELILISIVAGFFIAVPAMGPSSAIIVRRILVGRERRGLAFAAGSVLAEGLACLAAIWGVQLVLYTLPLLKQLLHWGGMLLLLGVGTYFVLGGAVGEEEAEELAEADVSAKSLGGQFAFGFSLTAFNPTLIATWTTVLGVLISMTGVELAVWQKWAIPVGVMVGETLWFAVLVAVARRFGAHVDDQIIAYVIRGIGVVLIGLALWSGYQKMAGAW